MPGCIVEVVRKWCGAAAVIVLTTLVPACSSDGSPDTKAVPALAGLRLDQAEAQLHADGFTASVVETCSDTVATGVVVFTDPREGTTMDKGATVTMSASSGPCSTG